MQSREDWLNEPGGIAERLTRLREAAGLTGEQVAERLGWGNSGRTKISKLENGRQPPKPADVTALAEAYGQPEAAAEILELLAEGRETHRPYRHRRREGHAQIQDDIDQIVRQGKRIRNFEVTLIPGLLQTPDYIRYRMLEVVRVYGFPEEGMEAAVTARIQRQNVLYEAGRQFEFVITEAALRLLVCPAPVMLGQIDRLMNVSGLGNVTLGIIPFDTELQLAPMHGFLIVDTMTYLETHSAQDDIPPRESSDYDKIADGLMAEAVTGSDAQALLMAAAARLREADHGA